MNDNELPQITLCSGYNSIVDENFARFKVDRNNMLMSSYFACTHVFDPNFLMGSSEIIEHSKLDRFYQFFDQLIN